MPAPRRVSGLLASLLVAAASVAVALPPGLAAAAATWPVSTGLVVAEVVAGGASASDEYVEIANAGSATAGLDGVELIYVTASGSTTTRKAAFAAPLSLAPGRHLVVANAAGIYASLADATYSGGLAADGGAVALLRADGTVVDAVGWGTAANGYVEGSPAPAPPAGASIERLPGGSAGNRQDTNDNGADWLVQPHPIPQPLGSAPPPDPTSAPTVDATPTASPSSAATEPESEPPATDAPPSPSGTPSVAPTPVASVVPSSASTPTGSDAPTPSPSPTPTPTPTMAPGSPLSSAASPTTDLVTIAEARAQPTGARAHVAGVVTVGLGLVGVDGLVAIADSTAGIFVRLPAPYCELPIGRSVELEGVLSAPYGQLEVRELDWLAVGVDEKEPAAMRADLPEIGEGTEGSLVTIRGTVDSIQTDGDRLTIVVGDGVNEVRALADPPAGISRDDVARGDVVLATGVVGQHATATGRLDGYRLWLRRQTDITVRAPIPTDPPDPTVRPAATRTPGAAIAGLSDAGESSEPDSGPVSIASLWQYVDQAVTVAGLVTAASGGAVTIDDGTGAIRVAGQSAAEALSMLKTGDAIEVTGIVRQDGEGLLVEADPDSIVDLPGVTAEGPPAASRTASMPDGDLSRTQAPVTSPAAAASVRIASSPAGPPDGAMLLGVLLAAMATVFGAVVLARHSQWRPRWRPRRLHLPNLAARLPRALPARRRGS